MRGKRSKQYRKLMQQYALHFGFREPYQVLLDADILLEAARCKMNFMSMLQHTLHGEIKPMITQCCMRHLYEAEPKNELVIEHAKQFERRRCNHHTLEKPLSALECLSSVVDPKGTRNNKHRYVVASQDAQVRDYMGAIPGVPLIYIVRSVMIMKPMSNATEQIRAREEQAKFRAGLKGSRSPGDSLKRKRAAEQESTQPPTSDEQQDSTQPKKKKSKGPKGPNPLSVKKPKKEKPDALPSSNTKTLETQSSASKRRRRRPAKPADSNNIEHNTGLTVSPNEAMT